MSDEPKVSGRASFCDMSAAASLAGRLDNRCADEAREIAAVFAMELEIATVFAMDKPLDPADDVCLTVNDRAPVNVGFAGLVVEPVLGAVVLSVLAVDELEAGHRLLLLITLHRRGGQEWSDRRKERTLFPRIPRLAEEPPAARPSCRHRRAPLAPTTAVCGLVPGA